MPVLPAVPSTTVPPGFNLETRFAMQKAEAIRLPTTRLCSFNYTQCSTVFHTAPRILKFSLAKYMDTGLF